MVVPKPMSHCQTTATRTASASAGRYERWQRHPRTSQERESQLRRAVQAALSETVHQAGVAVLAAGVAAVVAVKAAAAAVVVAMMAAEAVVVAVARVPEAPAQEEVALLGLAAAVARARETAVVA